jgi:hypothetical protein
LPRRANLEAEADTFIAQSTSRGAAPRQCTAETHRGERRKSTFVAAPGLRRGSEVIILGENVTAVILAVAVMCAPTSLTAHCFA